MKNDAKNALYRTPNGRPLTQCCWIHEVLLVLKTTVYWVYAVGPLDIGLGTVEVYLFLAMCGASYGRLQLDPTAVH